MLVSASRRNDLLGMSLILDGGKSKEKCVIARRNHQHARRVRYPRKFATLNAMARQSDSRCEWI
ncbi:MAG: hypothetical protein DME33_08985 [Verrucomicrobia bacterium]|nr:MAG: hypothetical protein DME33_08985 [Verrucomicrobiota bacterium]